MGVPETANPRDLTVGLSRVPGSDVFRTAFLRLVVDEHDYNANIWTKALTLLISPAPDDLDDPSIHYEVLGQKVRAELYRGDEHAPSREKTVEVGEDVKTFPIRVHILNGIRPDLSVTPQSVHERVETLLRQVYAQVNMRPNLVGIDFVDPVNNMICVAQTSGARAAEGDTFRVEIRSIRGGQEVQWSVVEHVAAAGDTPLQTAEAIAAKIRLASPVVGAPKGDRLQAQVYLNPATAAASAAGGSGLGSADILVGDPGGDAVRILDGGLHQPISPPGQQQPAVAPEAPVFSPGAPGEHSLTVAADPSHFGASIEQRMLIRNHDGGEDAIDVFVASFLRPEDAGGTINGQSTAPGLRNQAHGLPPGVAPIRNNAFVSAESMGPVPNPSNPASTHKLPFVLAHELGHVLLDAGHVQNDLSQLMRGGTGAPPEEENHSAAAKRISGNSASIHILGTGIPNAPASEALFEMLMQTELMRTWTPGGHK